MNCSKEILRVLIEAGSEGLSVGKIARHVFNAQNNLFAVADFEMVYAQVKQYLFTQSKKSDSPIMRTAQRGVYCINFQSQTTTQLMLQFREDLEEEAPESPSIDLSLNLFEDQ